LRISQSAFSQPTANDFKHCLPYQINYAADDAFAVTVVIVVVAAAAVVNRNAQTHLR